MIMKLLTSLTIAITLFAAAPALGQDAPATQPAEAGRAPTPAAAAPAPAGAGADEQTPEEKRTAMIAAIMDEMKLPEQRDTGVLSPDPIVPQRASEGAGRTDAVLAFINFVTLFFTVLILGLMILFAIRYRSRGPDAPDPEGVATHSTTLELTWTIIPTCIVLVMFALGFRDFLHSTVAPPTAYRVDVLGRMWNWQFTYENGRSSSDLHIPKGRPVQFYLTSQDVIHSLFIPAFRMKKDVVPGRFNTIWTEATQEGIFDIYCTEYCGTNHSRMIAKCFVYPEENYPAALDRITNIYEDFVTGEPLPPEQVGAALWSAKGCIGCHSVDGSILQAPSWKGLYGSQRTFLDGTSAVADENYIRQSILQPHTQIVQGYGATMPSYAGQLDVRDINSVIAYIRSLNDGTKQAQETGEVLGPGQSQSIGGDEQSNE